MSSRLKLPSTSMPIVGLTTFFSGHCFTTQTVADLLVIGMVDLPLVQTGKGIAECEFLHWFVQE